MTTTKKTIIITMSDRAPLKIVADDWPAVARATWCSAEHECQANEEACVVVRAHTDGRRIVYSVRDRGPCGMPIGYRGTAGGYLLGAGADTVRAIRRAAGVIGMPELGDECIADLPAEVLS